METGFDELKRYVRFTADDAQRLARSACFTAPHFVRIAQEFYERIREHGEAHAVFTGEEQIARLQRSLVLWLERVFGGVYDDAYFEKTAQIGRVHVRVGLPQRYMMTAMAVIRSSLSTVIDATAGAEAAATRDALDRLLDIELAVMLETYRTDLTARIERGVLQTARPADRALEHYVAAVELAPLLVVGLDASGQIVLFNREAERATGYARDEVLGRSFVQTFVPEDLRGTELAAFFAGGSGAHEVPLVTRAGKVRDVRWQVAKAPSHGSKSVDCFVIGADITDERIERERQQQQKRLAAVGTLAAGLAHEIRNPLNGAQLHIAFLARALAKDGSPDAHEAVQVVGEEIQRLARLVTEFLEFARPQPLVVGWVDARAMCERVVQLVAPGAESAKASIEMDMPVVELRFQADGQRLQQVLLNLLQNAIEAVAPGGGGKVTIRVRREPRHLWIEVEDNGPGMTEKASIFDAFYSTKPKGTGLGLAIAHRIVTDHAGSIDVESRPGRTRFRVNLPLRLPVTLEEAGA